MDNFRTFGSEPYDIVMLHGGPGAPCSLEAVSRRLSFSFGILEPAILSLTVKEQVEELHSIITNNSSCPLFFIGHSWGAWLCLLYASKYPDSVRKLLLLGTPPVEGKYVPLIEATRLSRLTEQEKKDYLIAQNQFFTATESNSLSTDFVTLLTKTDVFEALPNETLDSKFYPDVFQSVWKEASQMRTNGELINAIRQVKCPVVAIHGDFDPHPSEGVKESLTAILPNFRFNLIERCGHYPWKEKYGKDILYKIFYKEMGSTCV
jgi:pimeloyl-ACP methyl ester carboxylesterase